MVDLTLGKIDSTSCTLRYVSYVLHLLFIMEIYFYWGKIISNEISPDLANYQQPKRFFMMAYLVYAILYNYFYKNIHLRKDIDMQEEPVQFWYLMLWKYKDLFHIY